MAGEAGGTGVYCRLSHVRDRDDTTKVDDQERICRSLAKSRGWNVQHVWKDNNRSAWQRDRKRPGWQAMLEAIQAGLIRRIIVYHGDRLIRQPYDLELLINLADAKGIHLHSPTGTRDLDNPDDRFVLRIEAAQACRESDNISRRKKAGFERMRLAGTAPVPGGIGGRPFGFRKDGMRHMPREARALRYAAEQILAGATLASVCRELTARGLKSTTGAPLHYEMLRTALLRPRTAGLLTDGSPGKWKPVITPALQEEVRATLKTRTPARPVTTADDVYLLTGIAECYSCHRTVRSNWAGRAGKGIQGYGCCTPGCRKVRRNAAHLDAYVTGRVVGYLEETDFSAMAAGPSEDARQAAQELARKVRRRDEAREALGHLDEADEVSVMHLVRSINALNAQIATLEERSATRRQTVLARYKGITVVQFRSLPRHVQRQIIGACYRIIILPSTYQGPGFNPDDVRLEEREG